MSGFRRKLKDSVIVVLGASSGFGRGAAVKLAREGAKVVLAARRDNLLADIRREIESFGGEAITVHCDVVKLKEVEDVAQAAIEKYGRIDVWVNNAGIGGLGFFWEIPAEDQAKLIDINLKGLMFGAHVALKQFIDQGHGVLVNTGSIDSEVPIAFQATYAATKAGILSLGRAISEELRLSGHDRSIKVSTIMPWAADTPWWVHAANYTGRQLRMTPLDAPEKVVTAIVKACTHPELELPVGRKARVSALSHNIFPGITERVSGQIAKWQRRRAGDCPRTSGSLYQPVQEGSGVGGGLRERMKREERASRQ